MSVFKKRLEALLEEKELKQKDLAKKIGVSEVTISRYLTTNRRPRTDVAIKIAKELGVSTDYLLAENEDNHESSGESERDFTQEELELLEKIKDDPEISILFHDLKSAPKKKIKQLLKMWDFINDEFDDMENEE